jgi:transposase, IS5 family
VLPVPGQQLVQLRGGMVGDACAPGPGQPGRPTRLVAGLFIVKHMHNLSDEVLCARWLETPYHQFFCGELSFCHKLPFDRSSLMHWRQRVASSN